MSRAIIPGTFDPPTNGHLNLIQRVAPFFDEVVVVVAVNVDKQPLLSSQERLQLLREMVIGYPTVKVECCSQLIAKFAAERHISVLVRGVRSEADFAYELELAHINRCINPQLETLLLPADPACGIIRSSHIKSLWQMGGDLTGLVPEVVRAFLQHRSSA